MIKIKVCKYCGETDQEKLVWQSGYLSNLCKSCKSINKKKWEESNKEHISSYKKEYREANKDAISEYNRVYRDKTLSTRLENLKLWRSTNPDKVNKYSAKRRASIKRTLPLLSGDLEELNSFIIEEAYSLSRLRSDITNIPWHVDHIVPLNGKYVCGLHVGINLQVIPAKENLSKSNKF